MKVQVVGYRIDHEYGYGGWTGKRTNIREVVATFYCEKDAVAYIEDSTLKNPPICKSPFRKKSLLAGFEYAEIENIDVSPPHNPSMKRSK
jgi:hypothetical protein